MNRHPARRQIIYLSGASETATGANTARIAGGISIQTLDRPCHLPMLSTLTHAPKPLCLGSAPLQSFLPTSLDAGTTTSRAPPPPPPVRVSAACTAVAANAKQLDACCSARCERLMPPARLGVFCCGRDAVYFDARRLSYITVVSLPLVVVDT